MQEIFPDAEKVAGILRKRLSARGIECAAIVEESLGSTNSEGVRILKAGRRAPFAVIALNQTSGRGRLARKWFSKRGVSVALSVCVEIGRTAEEMESFTVRAGLGVCSELKKLCGAELFLKWPNDIYSREGRKIAGMLAELEISENSAFAVFGIGINADFSKLADGELPEEIRGSAGDLFSLSITRPELADIAVVVIGGVLKAPEYLGKVGESFAEVDWLLGRSVEVCVGNESFCGTARGVDARGRLKVELAGGGERLVCGGEATLKKNWRAGL